MIFRSHECLTDHRRSFFFLLSVLSLSHIVNSFISHSITDMTRITAVQLSPVYGRAEHFPKIRGSGAGKELKKNKDVFSCIFGKCSPRQYTGLYRIKRALQDEIGKTGNLRNFGGN